jgi:hypothetical protein
VSQVARCSGEPRLSGLVLRRREGEGDAQIRSLHAQLDVFPGKDLGALCAAYALHRTFLRAAADSDGADVALVLEEFGRDGARRRAHAVVELVGQYVTV